MPVVAIRPPKESIRDLPSQIPEGVRAFASTWVNTHRPNGVLAPDAQELLQKALEALVKCSVAEKNGSFSNSDPPPLTPECERVLRFLKPILQEAQQNRWSVRTLVSTLLVEARSECNLDLT